MINNNLCEACDKSTVCDRQKILEKFGEEAKKPLGIDITLNSCQEYKPTED